MNKLSKAMSANQKPISADGIYLRRGMTVFILHTQDAGKTWGFYKQKIAHTNKHGRVCFDEKIERGLTGWHICLPLKDMVGDHRIYATKEAAQAEASLRNRRKK